MKLKNKDIQNLDAKSLQQAVESRKEKEKVWNEKKKLRRQAADGHVKSTGIL